jgi:hypothetical protein
MTKIMAILPLLIVLLATTACVAAAEEKAGTACDGIRIVQNVPTEAVLGEKVIISFDITNTGADTKTVAIKEDLPKDAGFDQATAIWRHVVNNGTGFVCYGENCSSQLPKGYSTFEIDVYSYEWTVTVQPGGTEQVSFWITPQESGDLWLHSPAITVGATRCTLPARSFPVTCQGGHPCDPLNGENYLTCPKNCPNGTADNICNPTQDGQCDKDCKAGADSDCSISPVTPTLIPAGMAVLAVMVTFAAWLLVRKKISE